MYVFVKISGGRTSQAKCRTVLTRQTTTITNRADPLCRHHLREVPGRTTADTGIRGQIEAGLAAETAGGVVHAGQAGGGAFEAGPVLGVGTGGTGIGVAFVFVEEH